MTPERHALAKEIFLILIEADPNDREAILKHRCGDDVDLRKFIEQLLDHHNEQTLTPSNDTRSLVDAGFGSGSGDTPDHQRITGEAESSEHDYQPGEVLAGRYRIVARLGRGGMGVVYRAEDLTLGQPVALKFLNKAMGDHPVWLERLRKEVRLAREVSHPTVCRVYDVGECEGVHFLSMEYIDGEDLSSLLRRIGRLPHEKAIDIARQLCIGLAAAHAAGILHRDLKPANVMLDGEGRIHITDFGLAASPDSIPASELRAGTPAYMAPEQITGKGVSVRSDIYSLGLILYELMSGRPAFEAGTVSEFAKLHLESAPIALGKLVPGIDPAVNHVIHTCLLKDPAERPGSALEIAATLPGTDALAAALAANIVPTPEMVAVSRPPESRLFSANRLLVLAVLLIGGMLAARSVSPHPWERSDSRSPQVLAERARELLETVSPDAEIGDVAYGYCDPDDAISVLTRSVGVDEEAARMSAGSDQELFFWYRRSAEKLLPNSALSLAFGRGRVSALDPSPTERGSALVILDIQGRLRYFVARPATAAIDEGQENQSLLSDPWKPFIELAGLDPSQSTETSLMESTLPEANGVFASMFPGPCDEGERVRVDGVDYLGRPIFFSVRRATTVEDSVKRVQDLRRRKNLVLVSRSVMLFGLALIAVPWAWRNAKYRNWDRRGVIRLFVFVLVVQMTVWVLGATHSSDFVDELRRATLAGMRALGTATLVAVLYIALEPYARKHWPHLLITTSRVLAGRTGDPAVGQHVLVGTCIGCFWSLMFAAERALVSALGWTLRYVVRIEDSTEKLLGFPIALASYLDVVPYAIIRGMIFLLLLAALRALVGSTRKAAILAVLVLFPYSLPQGAHLAFTGIFMGIGGAVVGVWLMTRYGLLALSIALVSGSILSASPMSVDFSQWYSDSTVYALVFIAAFLAFGYRSARRSEVPV